MIENTEMTTHNTKSLQLKSTARRETRSKRLRPVNLIGIALCTGFLLMSGCSAKPEAEVAPTVTVQVDAAENEPIQRKVIAQATLYPLDQAAIVPKVVSPVKKFFVERGSRVKAGQLLAELENQDLAGAQQKTQGVTRRPKQIIRWKSKRSPRTPNLPKSNWTPRKKFTTAAWHS
jgi:biotin carboxyl carrier protein